MVTVVPVSSEWMKSLSFCEGTIRVQLQLNAVFAKRN